MKLSLVYFGDGNHGEMTYQWPGALHKARWMAKLLYSLKIALLEKDISELPGTVTTRQQVPKIRVFVTFVTHVYSIWWLTCKTHGLWIDIFGTSQQKWFLSHCVVTTFLRRNAEHLLMLCLTLSNPLCKHHLISSALVGESRNFLPLPSAWEPGCVNWLE